MNFSVHLPDPLLNQLDRFASANAKSRSSIVREAVTEYIAARTANAWPEDFVSWMSTKPTKNNEAKASASDWPDFDAIRNESNKSAAGRNSAL